MNNKKEVNYFLFPADYKRFNIDAMYKEIKKNNTIKWAVVNRSNYKEGDIVYIYYTNIEDRVNRILIRAKIKKVVENEYFYFENNIDINKLKFNDKEKMIKKYYEKYESFIDFNKEFSVYDRKKYEEKIEKEAKTECIYLDGNIDYLRPDDLTRFHLYKVYDKDIKNNCVLDPNKHGFGYGCFQQTSKINKEVYSKLINEVEKYCNRDISIKERGGQLLSIDDLYSEFIDKPNCLMDNFDLKDFKGNKYKHYYYKRRSGYNGLVGHHFIPRSIANENESNIDFYNFVHNNTVNMVYICPNCHDRIHHGIKEDVYTMIKSIYEYKDNASKFDQALDLLPEYKKCKTRNEKIEKLLDYYLMH